MTVDEDESFPSDQDLSIQASTAEIIDKKSPKGVKVFDAGAVDDDSCARENAQIEESESKAIQQTISDMSPNPDDTMEHSGQFQAIKNPKHVALEKIDEELELNKKELVSAINADRDVQKKLGLNFNDVQTSLKVFIPRSLG